MKEMTRREFLTTGGLLLVGAGMGLCGLSGCAAMTGVGESSFVAASIKCTHRGVEVEYQPGEKRFECASLGSSTYGLDGANLGGMAKTPLKVYSASLDPDDRNRLVIRLS